MESMLSIHVGDRLRAAAPQLLGTVALLAAAPPAPVLLAALLSWWALSIRGLTGRELVLALGLNLLFTGMDIGAVRAGVFVFHHPDWMGLPWWELAMWGFYGVHGLRLVGGGAGRPRWWVIVLAVAFAVPYLSIPDPAWLAAVAGSVLLLALGCMHRPADLAATGYFALLGVVIELTGMAVGHWSYPQSAALPAGAVVMWAGVGLFVSRLTFWWVHGRPVSASGPPPHMPGREYAHGH
jgi:hypothetical protein